VVSFFLVERGGGYRVCVGTQFLRVATTTYCEQVFGLIQFLAMTCSCHTDSVPTPGCFLQRVRKRLKRNELNSWCVQKSAKKCESVRRDVTRKGIPSDKVGTFGRFRKTIRSAKHAFCTGQVGDREWGMGSRDREEGTPPVEIKRVRNRLIAKGLMSGRCVGVSVRIWK